MERKFTGRHMLIWMVAFFGVVIAVNLTMARIAISSFGGVVVENSYVASQEFNGWLEQARSQEALGWVVTPALQADRKVALQVTGAPAGVIASAIARHPLGRQPDREITFGPGLDGHFVSTESLPEGRWTVRIALAAGDQVYRMEEQLQ